jgi:predicted glycogen debranching enzyme
MIADVLSGARLALRFRPMAVPLLPYPYTPPHAPFCCDACELRPERTSFSRMNLDLSREWLETNGLGSFASGTVCGANTRRYHALLCLAALPPQNRLVLVNKLDETLSLSHGGQDFSFDLGANIWPDAVHPQGYKYLRHFTADPIPTWTFEIPAAEWNGETGAASLVFEKALWMPHEVQATVVAYRLKSGPTCTLSARAFVSGRDFHGSHHANSLLDTRTHVTRAPSTTDSRSCGLICGVRLQPYPALPPVVFSLDGAFHTDADWYFCFEYPAERERGLDFYEDAWSPGRFEWKLSAENPTATLVTGTQEWDAPTMRATRQKEAGRRRALEQVLVPQVLERGEEADASAHSVALKRLARAADQFIVRRRDGLHTVLAGYPWFGDWGRDTMIALPGLCLANGRTGEALSILLAFSQSMSRGMIPTASPTWARPPTTTPSTPPCGSSTPSASTSWPRPTTPPPSTPCTRPCATRSSGT